jgi:hypothetical protein
VRKNGEKVIHGGRREMSPKYARGEALGRSAKEGVIHIKTYYDYYY